MLVENKLNLENNNREKGHRAERTAPKSTPAAVFENALRAFEIGDLSFADLLSSLTRLLKDGASAEEFMRVLQRRELIDPLPEEAREQIVAVLRESIPDDVPDTSTGDLIDMPAAAKDLPLISAPPLEEDADESDHSAMSRLINEFAASWDAEPNAAPPLLLDSSDAGADDYDLKAMRLALGQREDDLAALRDEHSRVLGLLEVRARSGAQLQDEARELAAQLEASRAELESQRDQTRDIQQVLAERIAAEEAARARSERARADETARLAQANRMESDALRESLAARDATIATLKTDRSQLATAQARIAALETQAASSHASTIDAASAQKAARAERDALLDKVSALQRSLEENVATLDAQKQQQAQVVAAFMARAKTSENDLQAARARIEAVATELQSRDRVAAFKERAQVSAVPTASVHVPTGNPRLPTPTAAAPAAVPRPAPDSPFKRSRVGQVLGVCAALAIVTILVYTTTHRAPPVAKAPSVAAPSPPAAGAVLQDCPNCPAFTVLPAGRFKQGSSDGSASAAARPLHWVAIGAPFAISTNAVTVDQFRAFVTATGRDMHGCDVYDGKWKHQDKSSWQDPGFPQEASHPVACVSAADAEAYAQWLSQQTGHRYRLPSASQWEYAARAGNDAAQPWSANGSDACANANVADLGAARRFPGWVAFACNDGYVFTAPVGSFKANAFGLHDMLGNLFQWTQDCWTPTYAGAPIDGAARTDGDCSERELRGGSWYSSPGYVRTDFRDHFPADYRTSSVGFRLTRDLAP